MKTGIKGILRILCIWFLCFWQAAANETFLPDELQNLYARSAVVMDGSSGRVLFGKNEEEVMPMASTTKIMTCILALENCAPDEVVKTSETAAAQPEVHLGAGVGETFYMEDLLYALMLESYNDAAVMIAEQVSGSVSEFAAVMNEKARELGCMDTHFVTPNGLDGSDEGGTHGTTAKDLARIMTYCAWNSPKASEFLKITQKRSYVFSNLEGTKMYSCQNHNAFLDMEKECISGKTGFTSAAGYCYVCAVESEERKFAGVVLACGWPYNRTYKWKDMTRMMDYARIHYREVPLQYPQESQYVFVEKGWEEGMDPWKNIQIPVCMEKNTQKTILTGDHEKLVRHLEYQKIVHAPVGKGMVLGKIQFFLNGDLVEENRILAKTSVPERNMHNWLVWTLQRFVL